MIEKYDIKWVCIRDEFLRKYAQIDKMGSEFLWYFLIRWKEYGKYYMMNDDETPSRSDLLQNQINSIMNELFMLNNNGYWDLMD